LKLCGTMMNVTKNINVEWETNEECQ